ncbi:MAG: MFS transporter [Rhodospirillales bacterium]
MIKRRYIVTLGISQLVGWGISFYLIGVFGDHMVADLGWSRALIYGGFSAALLVMGLVSPYVGRLIDRIGGRPVMTFGSLLCAASCAALARAETLPLYYGAWIGLGLAMRCMLYDAAFATLVRIAGRAARRPISYITLFGGLAASSFWPIGHALISAFGWRGALDVYALIAVATVALHVTLPRGKQAESERSASEAVAAEVRPVTGNKTLLALLYAAIVALSHGLNAGMSAHLISVLGGLGLGATAAVAVAALRGVGQSTARLIDVLFGRRIHPVRLNLIAAVAMPLSFLLGLLVAGQVTLAVVFILAYGGATGILTITQGTLPLVLFDYRVYGALVGKLIVPSFLLSAAAPLIYAVAIDAFGTTAALLLSLLFGLLILAASLVLGRLHKRSA